MSALSSPTAVNGFPATTNDCCPFDGIHLDQDASETCSRHSPRIYHSGSSSTTTTSATILTGSLDDNNSTQQIHSATNNNSTCCSNNLHQKHLTIGTHHKRTDSTSSPTTPPSPLYKNLQIDTSNIPPLQISQPNCTNNTPSSTPVLEDSSPSPTTTNVRNNVLQKISKWSELDNYGTPLEPTPIIPLKTPIKTKFLESGKKWKPFTTEDFLAENLKRGYSVGGIVDLSNHDCIYDVDTVCVPKKPDIFFKELAKVHFESDEQKDKFLRYFTVAPNLRKQSKLTQFSREQQKLIEQTETGPLYYIKVRLIAKEIPGLEQQAEFNNVINRFCQEFPLHYIGVHCSYGFNRTGFICCSYLISQRGIPIDEALNIFAKSKPPGIKHHWFLKALRKRYSTDPNDLIDDDDSNSNSEEFSM